MDYDNLKRQLLPKNRPVRRHYLHYYIYLSVLSIHSVRYLVIHRVFLNINIVKMEGILDMPIARDSFNNRDLVRDLDDHNVDVIFRKPSALTYLKV